MKKLIISSVLTMAIFIMNAQIQDSKIKIDSSMRNEVTLVQTGIDSSKSDIDLSKSDSNKISVQQGTAGAALKGENSTGFMDNVSNATKITVLITSILGLLGLLIKQYYKFKKKEKK